MSRVPVASDRNVQDPLVPLDQDVFDYVAVDISEAEVATLEFVGEAFVVYAELV